MLSLAAAWDSGGSSPAVFPTPRFHRIELKAIVPNGQIVFTHGLPRAHGAIRGQDSRRSLILRGVDPRTAFRPDNRHMRISTVFIVGGTPARSHRLASRRSKLSSPATPRPVRKTIAAVSPISAPGGFLLVKYKSPPPTPPVHLVWR